MTTVRAVMRWLLAGLFVAAGVMHFVRPQVYVAIMPPYLPWHLPLVYASGVCEILLGVMLLIPRVQRAAAWGLIVLLIAVFPANVHMALNPELFPNIPPAVLWARLPLQGVLIAWAWWVSRRGVNGRVDQCGPRG
jgi:uncharacterized membrane protein